MKHQIYQNEVEIDEILNHTGRKCLPTSLNIEEAMERVGQRHRYQIYVLIMSFLVSFFLAYGYMVIPYFFSAPEFQCQINGEWETCNESNGACDPNVKSRQLREKHSTITTDFELFCDERTSRVVIESFPLIAGVIGTFFFTYVSEKYGRRFSIQICWISGVVSCAFLNFSDSVLSLALGAFGVGFSMFILQTLIIVHLNELSIGQFRVISLVGLFACWSLSEMQYIWMFVLVPSWRWNMFFFYTLPLSLLMILSSRIYHDSPRYLYLKDRAKCLESLNRIATINGHIKIQDSELQIYQGSTNQNLNYLHLFSFSSQRKITLRLVLIVLFVNFLYQSTQVVLDTVGSSFLESSLYVGIGEFIGNILSETIANKTPRRMGMFISFGLTTLICVSFCFFQIPSDCSLDENQHCWQKQLQGIMISLARGIITITLGFQTLMFGEAYPVSMKSFGIGFNIALEYLGNFLAPFAVDVAKSLGIQPIVFIGVVCFIGNFSTFFTQETLNLPQLLDIPEIEEAQKELDSSLGVKQTDSLSRTHINEKDESQIDQIDGKDILKSIEFQ